MNHLTHQLKTPEQHFTEIAQTIALFQIILPAMYEDWQRHAKPQTTYLTPKFFVNATS
jgi:hypothetical protein